MPRLLRILVFALCISLACCVQATQPTYNYSDKTVTELLELLENKESTVRHCAAIFLGDRYRYPEAVVINGPSKKPGSPKPEFPLPTLVIPVKTL